MYLFVRNALGPVAVLLAATLASGCVHKQTAKRTGLDEMVSADSQKGIEDKLPVCGVRVHFDYDSTLIPDTDRPGLVASAKCMSDDRELKVRVEGNADERGTEEYNLALGEERAHSVEKYLKSLGAEENQLKTVSYGEENPVCGAHDEGCWSKNRRAAVRPMTDRVAGRPMAASKEDN